MSEKINPLTGEPYSDEYYVLQNKLKDLPANSPKVVKEIIEKVRHNDIVIVKAETGAGKSVSVVPSILKGFTFEKKIICTQPRSLNTETAKFVAKILDDPRGEFVNFAYKGNVQLTEKTVLSYETDGRVVNYFYRDPTFGFGDILVIDEVHEKNPYIEFLLLFMKKVLRAQNQQKMTGGQRKGSRHRGGRSTSPMDGHKKLVIMSATLDIDYYKDYFRGVDIGVVEIPGRTFPVESIFLKEPLDVKKNEYMDKIGEVIKDIVNKQRESGDILVFIPAVSQIVAGCRKLEQELQRDLRERVICMTLYRGITEDQKRLIQDAKAYKDLSGRPERKIVFSTNIAESGVTIDGIKFVIDTGLAFEKTFDSAQRMHILRKEYISKFEIEQRKGRAGRTAPGVCYHLYTENEHQMFKLARGSEIGQMNLDGLIMDLLRSPLVNTVDEVRGFMNDLIEPPSMVQLGSTFKYLRELQVIDELGRLTRLGNCLHYLALDVGIGLALMVADHFDVVWSVIRVASMLTIDSNISKWFRMPSKKDERKFQNVVSSYRGSYTDLQVFHKLSQEYRKAGDRNVWARNRFLNLHMFKKADAEARRIWQRYQTIPTECRLSSSVQKTGDSNKNMVLAFLHGYYNQVLTEVSRDEYRNLDGIFVKIRPGRFNSLNTLKDTMLYMELSDIMGRIQANGLINVTDPETLIKIAPHFKPLQRL